MVPLRELTEGFNRFDLHALTIVQQAGAMTPGEVIVLVAAARDRRREAFPAAHGPAEDRSCLLEAGTGDFR